MFGKLIQLTTPSKGEPCLSACSPGSARGEPPPFNLVLLGVFIAELEAEAHYLQVDLPIIMRAGNSEGLGDPGVEGVLCKLTHPRRDTRGMSREELVSSGYATLRT